MSDPIWYLLSGLLLITMVLAGAPLARLLLSSATIYLCVGYLAGPGGLRLIAPDPLHYADVIGQVAEVALLISLFTVGLRMGVPIFDRRWIVPLRLAFISMAITVGLIAAVGMWGLGLPLGAAVLLGGILAPTDPVLASGVQTERGRDPDQLRFSLAGEGALNDGTAYPFVTLGLALLSRHDGASFSIWRWLALDLIWASAGGVLVGAGFGALIGRLVIYLRTRHSQAVGLDEFLSLGLIAIAYGAAQLCHASGFLAVFAAGLALQRVQDKPREGTASLGAATGAQGHAYGVIATHSHHASAVMTDAVLGFNAQLERLAELTVVSLVGALLPYATAWSALWWFVPTMFVLVRPLSVVAGTLGMTGTGRARTMVSWFGIRGIGSVFYLMFAICHGVGQPLAQQLTTLTLAVVSASIFAHGISIQPLMKWYGRRPTSTRG
ncbi:sodium:proton antiporter [Burkholderia sp. WAC0059]|uniref:cation:proton antiporter n=1 Tax=Burkholderia sp. WAC0059 TaxID=2066022 RepID=UPI000C7F0DA8|nr:sodium:proton antiporter [Burkholderia sp. WAC0059]PLZ03757.1 sodium:proton antiporter [Burkholderia sp. WAC0059]